MYIENVAIFVDDSFLHKCWKRCTVLTFLTCFAQDSGVRCAAPDPVKYNLQIIQMMCMLEIKWKFEKTIKH